MINLILAIFSVYHCLFAQQHNIINLAIWNISNILILQNVEKCFKFQLFTSPNANIIFGNMLCNILGHPFFDEQRTIYFVKLANIQTQQLLSVKELKIAVFKYFTMVGILFIFNLMSVKQFILMQMTYISSTVLHSHLQQKHSNIIENC